MHPRQSALALLPLSALMLREGPEPDETSEDAASDVDIDGGGTRFCWR